MSTNENENENWLNRVIDAWLDTLDPKKLTFKKFVYVAKQCLNVMSLNDAGKFMTKHKFAVTDENIEKFNQMADKYYLIRKEILKELVLDEYNKSKNNLFLILLLFSYLSFVICDLIKKNAFFVFIA